MENRKEEEEWETEVDSAVYLWRARGPPSFPSIVFVFSSLFSLTVGCIGITLSSFKRRDEHQTQEEREKGEMSVAFKARAPNFCGPCGTLLPRSIADDSSLKCVRCGAMKPLNGA
jgi:hypothetical protein